MIRISKAPNASSLMATARSFGNYNLAGALADVIDNSIAARSKNIYIDCDYLNSGDCSISIRDDGIGMGRNELIDSMCPACKHPDDQRAPEDLGRFGWGMKSASFSQCRVLTVVSRKNGITHAARWNLDDIDDWEMDFFDGEEARSMMNAHVDSVSGTELIWTNCDRLTECGEVTHDQFAELVVLAMDSLSQVFHRYLNGDEGRESRIRIVVNGNELKGLDPFCQNHAATIPYQEEPIDVRSGDHIHRVVMQAFVLPHYSKLTQIEHDTFGGKEGYIRNQGFYVYRNRRLIISGTWFGLAKHGELSKLVRIRVDIPNALDDTWKITLDKSDAQLPSALKRRMKALISTFRTQSQSVIRTRGVNTNHGQHVQVWSRLVRQGIIRYSINKEHPLFTALGTNLNDEQAKALRSLVTMIESQLPVQKISSENTADKEKILNGFVSREELVSFLSMSLPGLMAESGSPESLLDLLKDTEPFASNMKVVEEELSSMKICV